MSYNVKLNVYEGPLDLLLFFIKRDEINIYDIPISHITHEYLDYIRLMQSMNLQVAGEFILMAALLMRIKVQMLLPRHETEKLEDIEDPRTELVQMLIEYQKYKEVSEQLKQLEEKQTSYYPVNLAAEIRNYDPELFLSDVTLIDLGLTFQKILDKLPKVKPIGIEALKVSVRQQILFLRDCFAKRTRLRFAEIATKLTDRIEVVVTFLAILEMIKTMEIHVSQKDTFGEIWLTKKKKTGEHVIANA
ncbi:MAG: segregation/condensation protein A [Candidatus Marinimicrobia bacterium]|jgi:segregation and condensation protein A|nr:segregation/condensation protein A [Candidatus Neomarinimicrobiota bacterium]MCK9483050.1 segregation/condensation protein A [Candidatus Neomarinimicrobiota bacterium]MCK9559082.1 segregation/condensation protein A [Candidatus Neomarinimicrobiota bacterium]MDD5062364.1 segregation/condensation protein A [Candidatus Neomarinimicrobiota bacterium]MDD5540271.1 segregation/condensation protein A [Candidatus Neomarinimicrobiota bacterium]